MRRIFSTYIIGLVLCALLPACSEPSESVTPHVVKPSVDKKVSSQIRDFRTKLAEGKPNIALKMAHSFLKQPFLKGDSLLLCETFDVIAQCHYFNQTMDSSIAYWRRAAHYTPKSNKELKAMFASNLGSAYMFKGYQRTAISYFFEAREIFDVTSKGTDNSWINHLNIGVCYMEMKDFVTAKKYFNEVPFSNKPALEVIVPLNYAKLYGLQGDYANFKKYIQVALSNDNDSSFYSPVLKEVYVEFVVGLGTTKDISDVYNTYLSDYGKLNVAFDLALWKAGIKLQKPIGKIQKLNSLLAEIGPKDFHLQINFYQTLADWYVYQKEYKQALIAEQKVEELEKHLELESAQNILSDYTILSDRNKLQQALTRQQSKNREQASSLKVRSYLLYFILCIFVLIVFISILIFINQRRKSILNQKRLRIQELELKIAKEATNKLEESLVYKDKKLQSILETVGKIAILKKQLDNFFVDMERIPDIGKDSRTSIKRAKLDFNLFFNNYQDLAVLSNLMMSDSSKILAIKEKYPTLKEQEYRVLLLIIQNYTSKEMAMLLSCTEKNIEYYRTQIRLKLEVPKDHGLKEFIQLEFQ